MTIQDKINEATGSIIVRSSAGTGKTYCLTKKIEYMIEHNISPVNMLVFTFTANSAQDLVKRLPIQARQAKVGTIHSVMYGIYRNSIAESDQCTVLDGRGQINVAYEAIRRAKLDSVHINTYLEVIGYQKNISTQGYDPNEIEDNECRSFARMYANICDERKNIDFDDMLLLAYDILRFNPNILANYHERWKYIFCDEVQDICPIQAEIIKLLGMKYGNIFVVGDEKQEIYQFRGSSKDFMRTFKQTYPDAHEFFLPVTYRNSESVCEVGNNVAQHIDKSITNPFRSDIAGHVENLGWFNTQTDEVNKIVGMIDHIRKQCPDETIRVLYRLNAQSLGFQVALSRLNIPFHTTSPVSLFTRKEIKILLGWLLLAYDNEATNQKKIAALKDVHDSIEAYDWYTYCKKAEAFSIGDGAFCPVHNQSIRSVFKMHVQDRIAGADRFPPIMFIETVIRNSKYLRNLEPNLLDNISGFLEFIVDCKTYKDVVSKISDATSQKGNAQDNPVELSTIHGSKGLEADTIFVTGVSDNLFPDIRSSVADELNLLYVAVTRSRDSLFLSSIHSFGDKHFNKNTFVDIALKQGV